MRTISPTNPMPRLGRKLLQAAADAMAAFEADTFRLRVLRIDEDGVTMQVSVCDAEGEELNVLALPTLAVGDTLTMRDGMKQMLRVSIGGS